jgi:hypothetical protein
MTKRTLLQINAAIVKRRRAGRSDIVSLASSMNDDDWQVVCCFYPAQARHGAGQFFKN